MTLRHLKIFYTVCEQGYQLTRAAQVLCMTQPAVSLAIKDLEQYYDVILFDRIGRRLQITPAGERFLQYASLICTQFDELENQMRSWNQHDILRIGASITIGSQFMPCYVREFQRSHPDCQVRVAVNPSEQLEQKLRSGELDFALIEGVAHSSSLISKEYMEDHLVVIASADSSFTPGETLSLEEFKNQNFLLREPGSGTREVFDRATLTAGFSVTPIWEGMSTTALVNAVISGLGIAVLPQRMVQAPLDQGKIIALEVDGLDFRRSFRIIHHKDKILTTSAQDFIRMCTDSAISVQI